MENKTFIGLIRWLIILAMPFFLGLGGIRAIIAWDYPGWEYQRIPSDQFGFTDAQRLELAHTTLDYMQRPEPADEVIYLLEDMRLPGTNDPFYNEREIEHMLDVKRIADVFTRVVWVTGVIVVGGLALLWVRPSTRAQAYNAILGGGIATTLVLMAIGLFIMVGWEIFFVQFHQLLFPPGTWTFAYTDSLIRLFPEQFWFDVGVLVSGGTLVAGLIVTVLGYGLRRMAVK
ncbi:MAG: TIGR01906 family membrane protein [Anaerolineales bacterium]|nr:TIGR01906 family membrane protein [Anaerolineales bacterium]MCA9975924.1 TIGR01906 family membrane protein [Anaerolineales bacterium]MCB8965987.1 TIGR01906 family membrane protein [Ardenticatenaceae bacterium]